MASHWKKQLEETYTEEGLETSFGWLLRTTRRMGKQWKNFDLFKELASIRGAELQAMSQDQLVELLPKIEAILPLVNHEAFTNWVQGQEDLIGDGEFPYPVLSAATCHGARVRWQAEDGKFYDLIATTMEPCGQYRDEVVLRFEHPDMARFWRSVTEYEKNYAIV